MSMYWRMSSIRRPSASLMVTAVVVCPESTLTVPFVTPDSRIAGEPEGVMSSETPSDVSSDSCVARRLDARTGARIARRPEGSRAAPRARGRSRHGPRGRRGRALLGHSYLARFALPAARVLLPARFTASSAQRFERVPTRSARRGPLTIARDRSRG